MPGPFYTTGAYMTSSSSPVVIEPEYIRYEFVRSSGPGGQNVNKVATAVQLRFDARNCRGLDAAVRERLYRLAGKKVNSAGEIVIEARRYRSQQRNRQDALERLHRLVERAAVPPRIRRESQPTESSRTRRLDSKKHRSEIKKLRRRASMENE
jgi:ribosome-associated protein